MLLEQPQHSMAILLESTVHTATKPTTAAIPQLQQTDTQGLPVCWHDSKGCNCNAHKAETDRHGVQWRWMLATLCGRPKIQTLLRFYVYQNFTFLFSSSWTML